MRICTFSIIVYIVGSSYILLTLLNSSSVSYSDSSCQTSNNIVTNCSQDPPNIGSFVVIPAIFKPLQAVEKFFIEFGAETFRAVITLFVVIDPIGIVPLFASFAERMSTNERKSISKTATITAGILLFVFAIGGTQIFAIFNIDIFSFMIAGGILLFIVSIELLIHGVWRFGGDMRGDDSGVVPFAFPLLAGPGAITSVIISYQTSGIFVTVLSIGIVIVITYIIFLLADPIYHILGRRGSLVITRVFAVLVAAFAVQYIVEGAKQVYLALI